MYFTLTRHTFGRLQSELFPVYFAVGSCLSAVALTTYYLMHPVQLWNGYEKLQVNLQRINIKLIYLWWYWKVCSGESRGFTAALSLH